MTAVVLKDLARSGSFLAISDLADRVVAGNALVDLTNADRQDVNLLNAFIAYRRNNPQ